MKNDQLIRKLIRGSIQRAVVFVAIIWINRRAAACIEECAKLLTD